MWLLIIGWRFDGLPAQCPYLLMSGLREGLAPTSSLGLGKHENLDLSGTLYRDSISWIQ